MLPPADEEVLRDNPEFSKLCSTLINVMLDRDGSTKHALPPEARGRNLEKQRLETARRNILTHATTLASPPEAAPKSPDSEALLISNLPFSNLDTLLPEVAALVFSSLHSTVLDVASLIYPTANIASLHRVVPCLPQDHAHLLASLSTAQQSLTDIRLRICDSLARLLECYTQSLIYLVRSLEAKYGVVTRSLELRASDVSLRAQCTEIDASQAAHSIIKDFYSPQTVAALRGYASHFQNAKFRMADHVHSLQAKLKA